jgi:hypothetical protein
LGKRQTIQRFSRNFPQHDELITTFGTLIASRKSVLDSSKIACLKRIFTRLRQTINITDDVLDQIADDLDNAGFDIQAPMAFAMTRG